LAQGSETVDSEQWTEKSREKGRTGMKLKDQAMFANLAIFAGMVVGYFQGFPILSILGCGVLAFVVVSGIFVYLTKRARRQRARDRD
jgi:hypothetical protein